jgi:Coenzyme PQQ synthesis protein D (PqqD)
MTIDSSSSSRMRKSADQVSCELNGEVAILNLKSTLYFGLDQVGATVWEALDEPRTAKELCQALLEKFDVDEERCHEDVLDLLGRLYKAGLIEIVAMPADPYRNEKATATHLGRATLTATILISHRHGSGLPPSIAAFPFLIGGRSDTWSSDMATASR